MAVYNLTGGAPKDANIKAENIKKGVTIQGVTGTLPPTVVLTEAEYNALLSEIREKAALVDTLYSGEITLDEVPADWQEEIQRRVNERITADGEAAEQPVSGDEFLSMIEGVL